PCHQARIRGSGAERAGVGQADGCALKVRNLKFIVAGAFDNIIVSVEQLAEVETIRALDIWYQKGSRTVPFGNVNGDADVDIVAAEAVELVGDNCVSVGELREFRQSFIDGVSDDMRERNFAP